MARPCFHTCAAGPLIQFKRSRENDDLETYWPRFGTHALIAAVGERASYRFFEFFTANIRNPNTRRAYARAAVEFFDWLEARGVTRLTAIESVHVAAYIEQL